MCKVCQDKVNSMLIRNEGKNIMVWGMPHYINWIENKMKLGRKKDSGDMQDLTKSKCCCFLICSNFVSIVLIAFCYIWLIDFFTFFAIMRCIPLSYMHLNPDKGACFCIPMKKHWFWINVKNILYHKRHKLTLHKFHSQTVKMKTLI